MESSYPFIRLLLFCLCSLLLSACDSKVASEPQKPAIETAKIEVEVPEEETPQAPATTNLDREYGGSFGLLMDPTGRPLATAICIHESGVFIAPALKKRVSNHRLGSLDLLLHPNTDNEIICEIKALSNRSSNRSDSYLAVFQATPLGAYSRDSTLFIPLKLGDEERLSKEASAIGFGQITSAPYPELFMVEIRGGEDPLFNLCKRPHLLGKGVEQSFHGAAVIDSERQIVAVVTESNKPDSRNARTIPLTNLLNLIGKRQSKLAIINDGRPAYSTGIEDIALNAYGANSPLEVTIQSPKTTTALENPSIDLQIGDPRRSGAKRFSAKASLNDGHLSASLDIHSSFVKYPLNFDAKIGTETFRGKFSYGYLKAGGRYLPITAIRSLSKSDGSWRVTLRNRQEIIGDIPILKELTISKDDGLTLAMAEEISMADQDYTPKSLHWNYTLTLKDKINGKNRQVFSQKGDFSISDHIPILDSVEEHPSLALQTSDTYKYLRFEKPISDIDLGGYDRYITGITEFEGHIFVLDLEDEPEAKFKNHLGKNSGVAAGKDYFYTINSAHSKIQIGAYESDSIDTVDTGLKLEGPILIGSAANRYLICKRQNHREAFAIFDLERNFSLIPSPLHPNAQGASLSTNAYGSLVVAKNHLIRLARGKASSALRKWGHSEGQVSWHGNFLYSDRRVTTFSSTSTPSIIPKNEEQEKLDRRNPQKRGTPVHRIAPSNYEGLFLQYVHYPDSQYSFYSLLLTGQNKTLSVPIKSYSNAEPLKKLFFLPDRKLIVGLWQDGSAISLSPIDIAYAMKDIEEPYLLFRTVEDTTCKPGELYSQKVDMLTNREVTDFTLIDPPEGMHIENTGLITWEVPEHVKQYETEILVRASTQDGMEKYFHFPLRLRAD